MPVAWLTPAVRARRIPGRPATPTPGPAPQTRGKAWPTHAARGQRRCEERGPQRRLGGGTQFRRSVTAPWLSAPGTGTLGAFSTHEGVPMPFGPRGAAVKRVRGSQQGEHAPSDARGASDVRAGASEVRAGVSDVRAAGASDVRAGASDVRAGASDVGAEAADVRASAGASAATSSATASTAASGAATSASVLISSSAIERE